MGNERFQVSRFKSGMIADASLSMYPSRLEGFDGGLRRFESVSSNVFGIVLSGKAVLRRPGLPDLAIGEKMYFSVPGAFEIEGPAKIALMIRDGYRGLFTVGGPVEDEGRLCYIDDCSVTQLVPPPRQGDPTLQFLCFPAGVNQQKHIHPTLRFGLVLAGQGECVLSETETIALQEGDVFFIAERIRHGFRTARDTMSVIAFHPDSDAGPTDQSHPMLSRTYLK